MGFLNAVVTLASFVGILWGLSGAFSFTLGGQAITIPGFMVWMAVPPRQPQPAQKHYDMRLDFHVSPLALTASVSPIPARQD